MQLTKKESKFCMNAPVGLSPEATVNVEAPLDSALNDALQTTPEKLKIALLGYRSHPHVGGQGIYLKYLSRALTELGHCVHVYSGQPYPELDNGIQLFKVPSLDLYSSPNHIRALRWKHLHSFTDFYEWWAMATGGFAEPYTFGRRVFKRLKSSDYDIIHDNQSLCFGLTKLQKRGHNVVSTIHHPIHRDRELALNETTDWGMRLLVKRWYGFLKMQNKVVRELKHVTTVSQQSQRDIEQYFNRASEHSPVIFNGVDTDFFCPDENVKKKAFTLLTTSSSDQPLKGLKSLLIALNDLRQHYPLIKLQILGELKPKGSNQTFIEKNRLEEHIEFHKGINNQDLKKLYNECTMFICPSLYEGFGLPAAEAMACGSAVISSDGGALPEVVGDAGLIYPAGDSAALTKAIIQLLEDKPMRKVLEQKARDRALHTFCWRRVAQQLSTYYRQILMNKDGNNKRQVAAG